MDEFASAVRAYCEWAEHAPEGGTPKWHMQTARRHLSSLYALAVGLPQDFCDCEPAERAVTSDEWKATSDRFGFLPVSYYGSILDPLEVSAGDTALGDLADDLADTWRDLKDGLILFDAGHRDAAGWHWQNSFDIHWGQHAVDALAIIHVWLARHQYRD